MSEHDIEDEIRTSAQKYVNDQMAIMEKYGHAPKLTAERYGNMVSEVIKVAKAIRNRCPAK